MIERPRDWITWAIIFATMFGFFDRTVARDLGQWENNDPAISAWYRELKQPDNPTVPCCGEADAYWADQITVEGNKVFAVVTDDRDDAPLHRPHVPVGTKIEVPPHKYKFDRANPTGHNILFLSTARDVFCFVQAGGV